MNGLQAVLTTRTRRRDDCRLALAELLAADRQWSEEADACRAEADAQLADVAGLCGAGRVDVRAAAARRYYAAQRRRDAALLDRRRSELAPALDAARADLAAAESQRQAVEKLIETRAAAARLTADRRLQQRLEDEYASRRAAATSAFD